MVHLFFVWASSSPGKGRSAGGGESSWWSHNFPLALAAAVHRREPAGLLLPYFKQ